MLLAELSAQADAIDSIAHLNNWWRKHSAEIDRLLPDDGETLKLHCATIKTEILGGLKAAA